MFISLFLSLSLCVCVCVSVGMLNKWGAGVTLTVKDAEEAFSQMDQDHHGMVALITLITLIIR